MYRCRRHAGESWDKVMASCRSSRELLQVLLGVRI